MIEPQGVKLTFNLATGEFNAEGPKEFVEENSKLFRETFISARAPIADRQHRTTQSTAPPQASNSINKKDLEKIFYADPGNGILAITREIRQHKDAVLLILAGFRRILGINGVNAPVLMKSLKRSRTPAIDRLYRITRELEAKGYLVKTGRKRATIYSLTENGMAHADHLLEDYLVLGDPI